jgi:DNA-binding NtrC family response regulator
MASRAYPTSEALENQLTLSQVLLVEDQPEVRRVVRRSLTKLGYAVVEAYNGRVAIELAQVTAFDLVISDVRMPDMNGLELVEALSAHDPDLPVVLTSGSLHALGERDARALGVFAYLEKPVPLDKLRETMQRALEERRARLAARSAFEPCTSVERLRVPRPPETEDDADE